MKAQSSMKTPKVAATRDMLQQDLVDGEKSSSKTKSTATRQEQERYVPVLTRYLEKKYQRQGR
jgi:ABC-type transporter MlaC component